MPILLAAWVALSTPSAPAGAPLPPPARDPLEAPRLAHISLALASAERAFDGAGSRRGEPAAVLGSPPPGRRGGAPAKVGRPPSPAPAALGAARRAALVRRAKAVLEANRESFPATTGEARFTAPDKERYPYQWLWDSSFHAIGLRHYDPARAADELRSLLAAQWPNGMIPNMVHARADVLASRHWKALHEAARERRPGAALRALRGAVSLWFQDKLFGALHNAATRSSGITQPPIVAEAAVEVSRALAPGAAAAFLREVYPPLRAYYDWIDRERLRDGLMVIFHSWESGTDNSPRFDPVYGVDPRRYEETRYNLFKKLPALLAFKGSGWRSSSRFAVKGVDMNSYYHKNLLALARVARDAGRPDEGAELEGRARELKGEIIRQLWDPARGAFRDLGLVGGRWTPLETETPFGFLPLYAGLLDRGDPRVAILVERLTDPAKFWTAFPVPTVALSERSFDPKGYWRGTTWLNVNYFLARGLAEHGYAAESRELMERSLAMVERGGMREYFNPRTGEGYRARQFSWTAALVIELDEALRRLAVPGR
ncbi:MAG: hypothetical protein HY554_13705 [Elusimicrobia bacterium]|nr:hypothetical protein [Elusimicrobiota bacterium]